MSEAGPSNLSKEPSQPQIFAGYTFCILGEADTPAVRSAIEASGGRVVGKKVMEDVDVYLVRLLRCVDNRVSFSSSNSLAVEVGCIKQSQTQPFEPNIAQSAGWSGVFTRSGSSRCLTTSHSCLWIFLSPFLVRTPISGIYAVTHKPIGAEEVLIGLSGLDQSESCHTKRLLKAFGELLSCVSRSHAKQYL